jgi:hypothetical protein
MLVSGYWIFKGNYPYFIQHQASSVQYLAQHGVIVRFQNTLWCYRRRISNQFGSGVSGSGRREVYL